MATENQLKTANLTEKRKKLFLFLQEQRRWPNMLCVQAVDTIKHDDIAPGADCGGSVVKPVGSHFVIVVGGEIENGD